MIFAYLDPAAGGMALQMIIAAVVAIPFFLRAQIARGVDRLRGRNTSKSPEEGLPPNR